MERKLKGMVLLKLAKLVKEREDLPWREYLTDEDLEMVKFGVMPGTWYPAETFNRMALAVFKLIFKEDIAKIKAMGKAGMEEMLQGPYKAHLMGGDPVKAIQKFLSMRSSYMNFSKISAERTGDKACRVTISEAGKFDTTDLYPVMYGAQFQVLVEVNNGRNPQTKYHIIPGQDEPVYAFDVTWE